MNNLALIILLLSIPALAIGLVRPSIFTKVFRREMGRKKLSLIFGFAFILAFVWFGVTAKPNTAPITTNEKGPEVKGEQSPNPAISDKQSSSTPETSEEPNVKNITQEAQQQVKGYAVVKVVDGDTVDVNIEGKVERLRLIGINTPETVDPRKPVECFGKEASNKAK